jgi:4'-phosphopantetheinyl transferase EntD
MDIWPVVAKFSNGGVLIIDELDRCQHPLLPEEEVLALEATRYRLRELRGGRAIARRGMRYLGVSDSPLLSDHMGAPVWPTGICGSLSHTQLHVAALIGTNFDFESVGVDIDDGRSLGGAKVDVATPEELELTREVAQRHYGLAESVVFSLKEAIFKCQCSLTSDQTLDFLDIQLIQGATPDTFKFVVTTGGRPTLVELATRMSILFHTAQGVSAACAFLTTK